MTRVFVKCGKTFHFAEDIENTLNVGDTIKVPLYYTGKVIKTKEAVNNATIAFVVR